MELAGEQRQLENMEKRGTQLEQDAAKLPGFNAQPIKAQNKRTKDYWAETTKVRANLNAAMVPAQCSIQTKHKGIVCFILYNVEGHCI